MTFERFQTKSNLINIQELEPEIQFAGLCLHVEVDISVFQRQCPIYISLDQIRHSQFSLYDPWVCGEHTSLSIAEIRVSCRTAAARGTIISASGQNVDCLLLEKWRYDILSINLVSIILYVDFVLIIIVNIISPPWDSQNLY